MFHDDSKYNCRQVLFSASVLLHLFIIILARQRVDQTTVDCENHEVVIIDLLVSDISVFGDMEQTI